MPRFQSITEQMLSFSGQNSLRQTNLPILNGLNFRFESSAKGVRFLITSQFSDQLVHFALLQQFSALSLNF